MNWRRVTTRIVLAIVAALGIAFVVAPTATSLVLMQTWLTISGAPSAPPPIAAKPFQGKSNRDEKQASFAAQLRQDYPIGSSASSLRKVLAAQQFQFKQPPGNPQQSAVYPWGNVVCGHRVEVWWQVDAQDRITDIQGYYYVACL